MLELPVVIKNKIDNWAILRYEEKDWCDAFQGQTLRFRKGCKTYKEDPYWEALCTEENISLSKFFELSKSDQSNWMYFDYKYMKDVLPSNSALVQGINWADLGLTNLTGEDSTLWIGNEGAHTPCHMDTYGCNLVAQIFGRKLWILISPEETDSLKPVRVPYEESSVYSSYNFYTPNLDLLKVKNAYKTVLNPGDVLFIPKHWWHYVENLETSASVNVWIPLESDHESRLEEALVRNYVSDICQTLSGEEARNLLNSNEHELISSPFERGSLTVFIENCKKPADSSDDLKYFKEFIEGNGATVEDFAASDIRRYVEGKCAGHGYCLPPAEGNPSTDLEGNLDMCKILINSHCHPKVVAAIREKLLGKIN